MLRAKIDYTKKLLVKLYNFGPLLLSFCALFWAGNFVVGRGVVDEFPPILLSQVRWIIASIILTPFAFKYLKRDFHLITNWPTTILLGILGVGCFNTIAYIGLTYTSAISGVVLQPSAPILILLTGALFFCDKISLRLIIAVMISGLGVITVAIKGQWSQISSLPFGTGEVVLVLAFLVWSFYSNLLKYKPKIHDLAFLLITFYIGNIFLFPLTIVESFYTSEVSINAQVLWSFAYLGFFPSLVAYLFYNRGVQLIGSARAGMFIQLVPFFGIIMSGIFLGEVISFYHIIGMILIIMGLWVSLQKQQSNS